MRGRFHGDVAGDNAKYRRGKLVKWVASTLLVSSAHAATPPHPARSLCPGDAKRRPGCADRSPQGCGDYYNHLILLS